MKKIIAILAAAMSILAVASCGSKEHKYTETELLLVDKNWAPDVNANLQSSNEAFESSTGISSDIQLGGDVKTTGAGRWEMSADGKTLSLIPGQRVICLGWGGWAAPADGLVEGCCQLVRVCYLAEMKQTESLSSNTEYLCLKSKY